MKYITLLMVILLSSCFQRPQFPSVVYEIGESKFNEGCVYYVIHNSSGKGSFVDKCGKYNIGDTVKLSR